MKTIIYTSTIESPLGMLVAGATNKGVCMLEFCAETDAKTKLDGLVKTLDALCIEEDNIHISQLKKELHQYFLGKLFCFTTALHLVGSGFQENVWVHLQSIPFGTTITYKQQSLMMNNLLAIRAIAKANALNRIAIVIPCHRVIGSNGKLTGYSGGLWRKKWLLNFEKEHSKNIQTQDLFSNTNPNSLSF
jgi:AraC family transcriptional regulator, regulatory protein of adaptative response / methylated-DNA-[protein]-cysteine methyltransferase